MPPRSMIIGFKFVDVQELARRCWHSSLKQPMFLTLPNCCLKKKIQTKRANI